MQDNYGKMYAKVPAYIYGFHGCHKDTYENVLFNGDSLPMSDNVYDWLGHGVYFWENSYQRAVQWAEEHYKEDGRVIGAFVDLGYCLDLTEYNNINILKNGYEILEKYFKINGANLPKNKAGGSSTDLLVRNLDCAVIETVHDYMKTEKGIVFDSVRGTFEEGQEIYPGAGFKEKTHTQVSVLNPNCIKGYFIPLPITEGFNIP